MKICIYIEGGGDGKSLKSELRRAFHTFFTKAGFRGQLPRTIACGSRQSAYDDFSVAWANRGADDFPLLLVDGEGAVPAKIAPWIHLQNRDQWSKPPGATDEQVHLMVQVMETWFLADKSALSAYYGSGFHVDALPRHASIEDVRKQELLSGLERASARTTKGPYSKGAHSFDLLAGIDPNLVQNGSPWACRLLKTLDQVIAGSTKRVCREPEW